jgi:hypothetical protein
MRPSAKGGHALIRRVLCGCSDMSRGFVCACEHRHSFVFWFVCKHAQHSKMKRQIKHQLRQVEENAFTEGTYQTKQRENNKETKQ